MIYRGTVKGGKIVLEDDVTLPEGVVVQILSPDPESDPVDGLADEAVDTGIPDLASQHDHYIYGLPKREE